MPLPRVQFTVRRMMIAVAVVGVILAGVASAKDLVKRNPEFGPIIVFAVCAFGAMVLLIALLLHAFTRLLFKDAQYAARLRRNDFPILPVAPDPPEPE